MPRLAVVLLNAMKIELYVTRTCPYCVKAKALLKEKGVAWEEHDITGNEPLIEEMVQRAGGRTTVPQIFINDHHVGGCDDLYALEAAGRLDPMLAPLKR